MDDLQISHKDPKVVDYIISKLDDKYGGIMPLSKSRGGVHEYLGMIFDYNTSGRVHISIYQYIHGLLQSVPIMYKNGTGSATPAPSHLYDIRDPECG